MPNVEKARYLCPDYFAMAALDFPLLCDIMIYPLL